MAARDLEYAGTELELFAGAVNWKRYLREQIAPYLGATVLEVGAGIGTTTKAFCDGTARRWVCLEPDAKMAARIGEEVREGALPACCEPVAGTLGDLPDDERFETVLYVDVLEHVEDDRGELARAVARLAPGGHAVVLSPAHQWLFTPFDASIGHFRRYTKRSLAALEPPGATLVRARYLDAVGMLASLGNRLVLRSASPTREQIALWDRVMVRASRRVDAWLGFTLGKSVLAVWRKDNSQG